MFLETFDRRYRKQAYVVLKASTSMANAFVRTSGAKVWKRLPLVPETSSWICWLGTLGNNSWSCAWARLRNIAPATDRPRVRPLNWAVRIQYVRYKSHKSYAEKIGYILIPTSMNVIP